MARHGEQDGYSGFVVRIETVLFAHYDFGRGSNMEIEPEVRKGVARREMLALFREWVTDRRKAMARVQPKADMGDVDAEDAVLRLGREVAILEMMIRNMRIEVD